MRELHVIQATLPFTQILVEKGTDPAVLELAAFKAAVSRLSVTTHKSADVADAEAPVQEGETK